MKRRKNAYWCPRCGGYTVTVDVDEGVTPMFLACRVKGDPRDSGNDCEGMAQSMMYPEEPWPATDGFDQVIPTEPAWEWYAPSKRQRRRLDEGMREHVDKGGLMLRKVAA